MYPARPPAAPVALENDADAGNHHSSWVYFKKTKYRRGVARVRRYLHVPGRGPNPVSWHWGQGLPINSGASRWTDQGS